MPRTIWMLWLQGWDEAPGLVTACRRSWVEQNPGWDVRSLAASDVSHYPSMDRPAGKFMAARSDIARIHLLREHGGVWADATVFCVRPLDQWLPSTADADLLAFSSPGYRRMLSSWLLASSPGAPIVSKWADRVDAYWATRSEPDAYFWFHFLFAGLHDSDVEFRRAWRESPALSAAGPHYFSPYGRAFVGPMGRRASARLAARVDPVYKLTTRTMSSPPHPRSAAQHFLNGATPPPPAPAWSAIDSAIEWGEGRTKSAVNAVRALRDKARGVTWSR